MTEQSAVQQPLNAEEVQYILEHHQAPQSPPSAMSPPQPQPTPAAPVTHAYPLPIASVLSQAMSNRIPDARSAFEDEDPYEGAIKQPEVSEEYSEDEVVPSADEADEADEASPAAGKKKKKRSKTTAQKARATCEAVFEASKARVEEYMAAGRGVPPFLAPDVFSGRPATTSRAARSRRFALAHRHAPQTSEIAHVDDEEDDEADADAAEAEHNHDGGAEGEGEDVTTHTHSHTHNHNHAHATNDDGVEGEDCNGCTCGRNLSSIPPIPCTAASPSSTPYSTAEFDHFKAFYSKNKIPTLLKAANLKLRADHAHNTWYGLIVAVRACPCASCSDVIFRQEDRSVGNTDNSNLSYETLVKPAREEYQKLDTELDAFLTSQRPTIFKEWLTTKDAKEWPRSEILSIGQIRGMLPDGRDKSLDVGANPEVDFERVMRYMTRGDDRRQKRMAGKEGGKGGMKFGH